MIPRFLPVDLADLEPAVLPPLWRYYRSVGIRMYIYYREATDIG